MVIFAYIIMSFFHVFFPTMQYNVIIMHIGDGAVGKRHLFLGLAVLISLFSTSCSSRTAQINSKNVVVSAANVSTAAAAAINTSGTVLNKVETVQKDDNVIVKAKAEDKNTAVNKKEVFITFDDGPTKGITSEILDILKKYNVKATFFVIGKMADKNSDLLIREKNEGHYIANHSFSHDYKYLYSSPVNFVEDISKADAELKKILPGYSSKLIRFPGGSFGKEREDYRQAITAAGYHYVDWNAINGDAEGDGKLPADKLLERLKQTSQGKDHVVVLMHDAPLKQATVQALPKILEYFKANGYMFKTLE